MPPKTLDLSNLSRSMNEMLVLAALEHGPRHGYQLALDVDGSSNGLFTFKHGTLYPILHRLERQKLIVGSWSDEGRRGRRRAYELTAAGRDYTARLRTEWRDVVSTLLRIIGEEP